MVYTACGGEAPVQEPCQGFSWESSHAKMPRHPSNGARSIHEIHENEPGDDEKYVDAKNLRRCASHDKCRIVEILAGLCRCWSSLALHAQQGLMLAVDNGPFSKRLLLADFDIIGAVTMGQDFRAQVAGEESELLKAYMSIVSLYKRGNGPRIPGTNWFRERKQRGIAAKIERLLQDTVRREFAHVTSSSSPSSSIDARSVLGLSLQGTAELTPELLQQTSDNLRVFMFAGHDTTSILLQWAFYELSRSPKQRAALVAELDALFGPDTADDPQAVAAALLQSAGGVGVGVGVGGSKGGAELLGAMTYGAAVIKETLRLHPPAATVRMTPPGSGFELTLPPADGEGGGGKTVCADGCIMYLTSYVMQRDVGVWGDTVDEFVPERWLGDTSWMPAGAWRPFERGPRSCIGLELANIEAKVILALLARRYDFVKVGLGELDLDGEGLPVLDERGYHRTKSTLFSSMQVTSKPVDGMLMKVKLNKRASTKT